MIRLAVFDLWNTIAYHQSKKGSLKSICERCCNLNYREFLKAYEKTMQLSKGVSFEKGFRKLFDELNIKASDEEIKRYSDERESYESDFRFYKYIAPLIRELKKNRCNTALLSNTSSYLGERIKKTETGKKFDKIFFSYELHSMKPDSKNFKKVMKHFRVKPEESVMTGDNYQDDFLAAKKLGMHAIHFKDGRQVRRELKKMGAVR